MTASAVSQARISFTSGYESDSALSIDWREFQKGGKSKKKKKSEGQIPTLQ